MKRTRFLKIIGALAAMALLSPTVFAQCQSNVPSQLYLGETACVQVCANDFTYPAIELIGNVNGSPYVPILIFGEGCNPASTNCENPDCTPLSFPDLVYGGDPFYPNQWYGQNDCFYSYLYYGHDAIWWLEIYTLCDGCFCITYDHQLPVNMSSDFAAVGGNGEVELSWATASENNNDHFDIERGDQVIARITGNNGPTEHRYSWTDNNVQNGETYTYNLWSVDIGGHRELLGTASANPSASAAEVTDYALLQNYPNPFNPTTNIQFDVLEASHVTLRVFNPMGEQVATLINGQVGNGRHSVLFDGTNLTSGLYFYTISIGDHFTATRKMLLVK